MNFYILLPIAACIILFILEQLLMADYITKTIVKMVLFLGIPLLVHFLYQSTHEPEEINTRRHPVLWLGFTIGTGVFAVIILAYGLFRGSIDSAEIITELTEKSGITRQTYFYSGIYIAFGNSFLEEFFFRRHIFWNLYKRNLRKAAYIASALLFSVYHLAIFNTWFSPLILLLALSGLMAAGLFLNYIVVKTKSITSPWIIHICANLAIIGIGYTWF